MKTFEEKWTAWLDGELTGKDLTEFEASLPDLAAAEEERREAHKLGGFLREHIAERKLGNEDFFNHQLRHRLITAAGTGTTASEGSELRPVWPIRRLIWGGLASLALFLVVTVFVMRQNEPADQSFYLTQILNARVDPAANPNATVSIFQAREDKATVLWVDGLQSLPAEYATK